MILKELSTILIEDLGAVCPAPGDDGRAVNGLAVEEGMDGWIEAGEVGITSRKSLAPEVLDDVKEAGGPALIWRTGEEAQNGILEKARELGVGLFILPPQMPLKKIFSVLYGGQELLLHSHGISRTLLEDVGGEPSIKKLAEKISELLGSPVIVEDPVGRLLVEAGEPESMSALLEEQGLRGIQERRGGGYTPRTPGPLRPAP